jgi:isopenicillin-N epimerase
LVFPLSSTFYPLLLYNPHMITPFGHDMLELFPLEPQTLYLNHGTVGVTPKRVLAAQQALREAMERQPARFVLRELSSQSVEPPAQKPRLRAAADAVAQYLGAKGEDLVFVDNATTGINAILRSLPFGPGDEILIPDLAYGAVINTARYVARERGAKLVTVELPFPVAEPAKVVEAIEAVLTPRTKILIVDHITAETALLLPLEAIIALCKTKGVPVLVDGAHAPGAIPLNLEQLGADWYVGNLHKWAFAPRGCGILWAKPERQQGLHPTVISWGLDNGYTQEFDWLGTKDPTPFLAAPKGFEFIQDLGETAMREYNHNLARQAAHWLSERLETELNTPRSMMGCLVSVGLPKGFGSSPAHAAKLKDALFFNHHIEIPILSVRDHLYARISAQVYNEMEDIERLEGALKGLRVRD